MLKSSNFWLFMGLGLNFWLVPVLPVEDRGGLLTDGLLVSTLLAAIAFQGLIDQKFRHWSSVAALFIVAAIVIEEVLPNAAFIESAAFAVCFAVASALYFHTMTLSLGKVTFDTIFSAASTYILIGMLFAAVFGLILEMDHAAFSPVGSFESRYDLLYYSFATLTTLGAADIIPVSDAAKMLTVFEALIGMTYIAFLVGSVVGAFSAEIVATKRAEIKE